MAKKPPSGTQAVRRAIALLKAFQTDRPERDLGELARATGLSRSTAHRLLAALESEGLVVRERSNGRYRLGPAIAALGARALRASRLRELAHPVLESLAEATGETATLEVLSEGRMLILDEVLGARLIGASPSLGTAWAVHATSTGKALLAALPAHEVNELLDEPLVRFTPRTITKRSELDAELERVREDGFAMVREELEEGYAAAGAAIRVPFGSPTAALSLGGPAERLTPERLRTLGTLLRSRARELSRRLGYEDEPSSETA